MFQDQAVMPLFPTYLWAYDLRPDEAAALNSDLVEAIEAIISPRPELGPGETWQTDQVLHEMPEFQSFVKYAEEAARRALVFLKVRHEGFRITGCWANINPPGTGHPGHAHPNNFLSGVYYPKVKPGADSITFNDPRVQTTIIAPHVTEVTDVNAVQAHLPIREGRFLVFPSWVVHSVDVNRSDSERMSIAFNIMFTEFAEKMAHPLWRSRFASKKD